MAAKPGTSPSSDDRPTDTIRWIGQYRVISVIKRGGQGVVYRALDNIGRDVAIKELQLSELAPDEIPEARQRGVRDAQALGKLKHNNIVIIHQFIEEPNSLYLVMEFVPGGALQPKLIGTTGEALEIVRQVASALDYAHKNDIVHRDIKPGNILVASDPVSGLPVMKVTDFGIARISSQTMTMTGVSMGTPAYMAPEQIKGLKVDAKADQFSLGVLAYQLLGGRLPFTGPSHQSVMFQIVNEEPESLLKANPAIPREVDRVVRKALAKNPGQRFDSCGVFAGALEQALAPLEPTTRITVRPKPGANRILVGAAWGALLAVAVAIVLYLGWLVFDRPAAKAPPVPVVDSAPEKPKEPPGETAPATSTTTAPPVNRQKPAVPEAVKRGPRSGKDTPANRTKSGERPQGRGRENSKVASSAPAPIPIDPRQTVPPVKAQPQPIASSAPAPIPIDPRQTVPPVKAQPQPMLPKAGDTWQNPKDGLVYAWIPPGDFTMGCSSGDTECFDNEKPPHAEQIANGFWLSQTEVTQAAWKKVNGGNNPSYFKGDTLPVEYVDWNQASAYCRAIGGRLPTEKEWEYAAREGKPGARYGALDAIAWYGNSGGSTHPVGLKKANAWGLYDMLGNVWEWTATNYDATTKVVRGGSWYGDGSRYVRASNRGRDVPTNRFSSGGFRCVGELR